MREPSRDDIARLIRDGRLVDRAVLAARRGVVRRHRQMGVPLAVWKDGHVVELDPDSEEVAAAIRPE